MVLMNQMYVRHLIATYEAFGGDVVAAIVLGEVAHHNLASLTNNARTPHELSEAIQQKGSLSESFLPTNAFSIAQATGIPRETVRRKVVSLARRGWLMKDAEGNLFVTQTASVDFATFNVERMRDLLESSRAVEALCRDTSERRGIRRRRVARRPRRADIPS